MFNKVSAAALKAYLSKTGYVARKRVEKLIIDACSVSDESFSLILEGLLEQCGMNILNNTIKAQYIQSIIYSNNDFGIQSQEKLEKLLPNLFELKLNNLRL